MAGNVNLGSYLVDPATLTAGATTLNGQVGTLDTLLASTTKLLSQLTWQGAGYQKFEQDLTTWNGQVKALQGTLSDLQRLLNQAATQYGSTEENVTSALSGFSA